MRKTVRIITVVPLEVPRVAPAPERTAEPEREPVRVAPAPAPERERVPA